MEKIAVLSSGDSKRTINWIKDNYEVLEINFSRCNVKTKDGKEFILVSRAENIVGMEFDSYIKSPSYYSLEDMVKARLKKN